MQVWISPFLALDFFRLGLCILVPSLFPQVFFSTSNIVPLQSSYRCHHHCFFGGHFWVFYSALATNVFGHYHVLMMVCSHDSSAIASKSFERPRSEANFWLTTSTSCSAHWNSLTYISVWVLNVFTTSLGTYTLQLWFLWVYRTLRTCLEISLLRGPILFWDIASRELLI